MIIPFFVIPILVGYFSKSVTLASLLYAHGYPYSGIDYASSSGRDSGSAHGGTDTNAYVKNLAHDQGNNLQASLDVAKFKNLDNQSKGFDVAQEKAGSVLDQQKRTIGENFETDKTHNRKHVKSGFHNTYNKDESGSNSSYYEDSDDRGGKLVYDKRHGTRGDAYDAQYREGVRDGSQRDRYDNRYGGYDSQNNHDQQHLLAKNHGNAEGYSDQYNRGHGERYETVREQPLHGHGGYGGGHGYGHGHGYQSLPPLPPPPPHYNEGGYYRNSESINHHRHPNNLVDYTEPLRSFGSHNSPRISSELPPPPPLAARPFPTESNYNRRITIYEDPRDTSSRTTYIDQRVSGANLNERYRGDLSRNSLDDDIRRGGITGSNRRNEPELEFRPSPFRVRNYYDEQRRNDYQRQRNY